jgi:hypothetical protein
MFHGLDDIASYQISSITERCQQMAVILKSLKHNTSIENQARISDLLEAV